MHAWAEGEGEGEGAGAGAGEGDPWAACYQTYKSAARLGVGGSKSTGELS